MNEEQTWVVEWFAEHKQFVEGAAADRLLIDYFAKGLIDSFGVVALIGDAEAHFKIQFLETDFQDRRFSTLGGLAEIIAARRTGG
jgi:D-alanine--poly(phosphoribitol) ligase subunit 2